MDGIGGMMEKKVIEGAYQGKKKEANDFGAIAEEKAAQEYMRRGYTVLARRWRMGKTEIDLIVQNEDTVVIVEVKARKTTEEDALESVTPDKRRRMVRAADSYIRSLKGEFTYRFDIVACHGSVNDIQMTIYEDAFTAAELF